MDRRTLMVAAAITVAACGGDDDESGATTTTSTTTTVAPTTTTAESSASYTIESGDTLAEIAQRFGTSVEAIAEANGIADPNVIAVGQELEIPPAP